MRDPLFLEPRTYKVDSCIILKRLRVDVTDFSKRFVKVRVQLRDNSMKDYD